MPHEYIPEKTIKERIVRWLNTVDGLVHFHYPAYAGIAGIPDRLCCKLNTPTVRDNFFGEYTTIDPVGQFIAIEVKKQPIGDAPKIEPSVIQKKMMEDLKAVGAIVILADSVEDVKKAFKDNNLI